MKLTIRNRPDQYSGVLGFVAQVVVMTLATLLAAYVLPDSMVRIDSLRTAILAAMVIALLNNFIRPILIVITLPFTIFSMGLFLLVINAVIIMLASGLVNDFHVYGFGSAFIFSLLLTFLNYLLEIPNRLMRRPKYEPSNHEAIDGHTDTDEEGFSPYEEIHDDEEQ